MTISPHSAVALLPTPTIVPWLGLSAAFTCLSVCQSVFSSHDISKWSVKYFDDSPLSENVDLSRDACMPPGYHVFCLR